MLDDIKDLIEYTKNIKLLYVEDNQAAREQTQQFLSTFFDDIIVAVDGQDGFNKFQNNTCDLIITDISMPTMNGIEMLTKIREIDLYIPCIIMSAYDDSSYFLDTIKLGVDGYILKPVSIELFINVLKKIVNTVKLKKENICYMTQLEDLVKEKTKELKNKLYYDDLTGLRNRYFLIEEISKCSSGFIPVVIMLDIDSLKTYNELYGIESGNNILVQVAKKLEELVKNSDFKVYRLTSDEFVIFEVVKQIDINSYEEVVATIFDFFSKNKLYIDNIQESFEISLTIGLAFGDENTVAKASSALYEAKKDEKKFAIFRENSTTKEQLKNILYWKKEIKKALEKDNIVPYFHPIVDRNKKIVKYESLIRLKQYDIHGSEKIISPASFLEISFQTRQYDELSYTMLEKTIQSAKDKNISISINLDYRDIYNKKIMTMLKKNILEFYEVNKDNTNKIILEILENHEIRDYDAFTSQIAELQEIGALIAIDDFGTGYSNLTHIIGISPHYLKIDGSLIKDIVTNEKSKKIVQGLVQLAKKLDIKTIAEFVADKNIFDVVYELGIDEFQGYYFAEPMSLDHI